MQNWAMVVIYVMTRLYSDGVSRYQDEVTDSCLRYGVKMAKMSDGDVDVEPYLDSRNTKGYGTATQILTPLSRKCGGERNGPKWLGYAEMVEVCGSICGIWWAPEKNLVKNGRKTGWWMEMLLPGVGCPGGRPDVRA